MAINRPIKALFYAPPGTGKSVFASRFPKPFFICTDGNYEWLLDFGADPNAHKDISSYAEFEKLALTSDFNGYDTIVVDLLEDIYKWNEAEFCKKQGVDHLSDAGAFGKGWDITRTRLFVACCKLLSLPKNVIFLSHESSYTTKDRRGNESTHYTASSLMGDKFIIMLEGRLRYFLRCLFKDEVRPDGKIITHRMLSLVPKSNEFGIIRGVDVNVMPQDIPLDAQTFLETVGYDLKSHADDVVAETAQVKKPTEVYSLKPNKEVKVTPEKIEAAIKPVEQTKVQVSTNPPTDENTLTLNASESTHEDATEPAEESKVDKLAALRAKISKLKSEEVAEAKKVVEETKPQEEVTNVPTPKPEKVKVEVVEEKVEVAKVAPTMQPESTADKLAAIRAKLAALKAKQGGN